LEEAAGCTGVAGAAQVIRRKVFAAIAAACPDLAEECSSQRPNATLLILKDQASRDQDDRLDLFI